LKISVIITLKKDVLDPQGQVIQKTLNGMGFSSVDAVRQGKFFDININETDKRKAYSDVYIVVTDSVFLVLEPDHKVKNVARLISWATLPSLEQLRRNLDNSDYLTF